MGIAKCMYIYGSSNEPLAIDTVDKEIKSLNTSYNNRDVINIIFTLDSYDTELITYNTVDWFWSHSYYSDIIHSYLNIGCGSWGHVLF